MTRIWFNHWFSTLYNIIDMIKKADDQMYIICTNENEISAVSQICDEYYTEPMLKDNDYVDFCLEFCRQHEVDVFIPRREMIAISKNKARFQEIGTKVMVDEYETVSMLNHKDAAYKELADRGVTTIPDYHIVTTVSEFTDAYNELRSRYRDVCFKFVHDEGGKSFRLIDNNRKGYYSLFKKQNTRMTLDSVIEALSEKEKFSPVMIMPNLSGDEVSADCLMTSKGLIAIPRIKSSGRVERITFDDEILSYIEEIYNAVKLEYPCNIQLKYLDGKPYFLEVNTRMSGGVQLSCAASGVNIPYIAVNKILGIDTDWSIRKEEHYVMHVETPIVL